jgi:hypothetical protein
MPILELPIMRIFADDGHIEIFDFGGDLRRKILGIEQGNPSHTGLSGQDSLPNGLDFASQRRN